MTIRWSESIEGIDWDAMSTLYRIAPLGDKRATWLRTAYSNSMFRLVAYDGDDIVAAGRAVADGVDCAYLCDIVVHPDRQGTGVGSELIERLVGLCGSHRKIILYAVPGREPFYARFGFRRMTTAMAIFEHPDKAAADGYTE